MSKGWRPSKTRFNPRSRTLATWDKLYLTLAPRVRALLEKGPMTVEEIWFALNDQEYDQWRRVIVGLRYNDVGNIAQRMGCRINKAVSFLEWNPSGYEEVSL